MRREAKAINFGIVYGLQAFGLSKQLGIERKVAQKYIDQYFEQYAGVKGYIDGTLEEARRTGYVTTLLGRKRALPDLNSKNYQARSMAERMAVNTPIQGTGGRSDQAGHAGHPPEHPAWRDQSANDITGT